MSSRDALNSAGHDVVEGAAKQRDKRDAAATNLENQSCQRLGLGSGFLGFRA